MIPSTVQTTRTTCLQERTAKIPQKKRTALTEEVDPLEKSGFQNNAEALKVLHEIKVLDEFDEDESNFPSSSILENAGAENSMRMPNYDGIFARDDSTSSELASTSAQITFGEIKQFECLGKCIRELLNSKGIDDNSLRFISLGRSPIYLSVVMESYVFPDSPFTYLPISSLKGDYDYSIKTKRLYEQSQINIDSYLESMLGKYESSSKQTLVVIDLALSGRSIKNFGKLLNGFINRKQLNNRIDVLLVALTSAADYKNVNTMLDDQPAIILNIDAKYNSDYSRVSSNFFQAKYKPYYFPAIPFKDMLLPLDYDQITKKVDSVISACRERISQIKEEGDRSPGKRKRIN